MSLRSVTAVVFDLDGTLCYYSVSVRDAIAESLYRLGQPGDLVGDLDAAAERYDALWDEIESKDRFEPGSNPVLAMREQIWTRLLAEQEITNPDLAREIAMEYTQIRVASIQLCSGACDLLADLKRTYRLGLLTNGPSGMQWPKIEQLEIAPLFDAIVVAGDVGIYKPDARVFHVLLDRLNVNPAEALYVGDSYRMDVVGAKGAGMQSVWVRNGNNSETDGVAPDLMVQGIDALRGVLL
jgi:HAD superfamily hydrolase (TIGR01549 family)